MHSAPNKIPAESSRESAAFLHESGAFASILRVERMRSDRSDRPFSLAVFDAVSDISDDDAASRNLQLARELKRRVRVTDHVGQMSNHRVGVILWDTEVEGAWSFVDEARALADPELTLNCEVFVYPTNFPLPVEPADGQAMQPATAPLEPLFVQPMPIWKRTIDLFGATLGLVLLAPLFAVVAAAIKFTSRGPVLFTQLRSGRGDRPFKMYKFRSMVAGAEKMKQALLEENEQDGPAFKIENDPRITAIGHFIRKTSIDELPQLLNVIRGEMSLVGPRPLPCPETDACENWQRRRLEVTPGLTCIWQVQDRRTKIPFADWARMDIRYIGSRTLKHDLQLVLKTIRSIVGRKGA